MGSIAERNVHVKRYKQVVIDGYTWLHKACYACSREVVLSTFQRQKKRKVPLIVGIVCTD